MPFINRETELTLLQELYEGPRAVLFIAYGRRRVGKTELLRHFCQNRPHLFFAATQTTDRNQLSVWFYSLMRSGAASRQMRNGSGATRFGI
jgi:hypothetical protein